MKKRFAHLICICLLISNIVSAQKVKKYEARSQDENITVSVEAGNKLQWSVQHKGRAACIYKK